MKIKHTYSEVRAIPDDVEETRTIDFIISSEKKDRHGTILNIDGWILDAYTMNPIVGYQHNVYGGEGNDNPDMVIGKSVVRKEGNLLIASVTFEPKEINPVAEKVFRKIIFGSLRTASVGFLPVEKGKWGEGEQARDGANPTFYYGKRELLEWSVVNIPSNSEATLRAVDDPDLIEEKKETQEPTSVPDAEMIRIKFELTKIV